MKGKRYGYIPPVVIQELDNIKIEEKLEKNADAFKKMVEHSRIGREVQKMRDKFVMADLFKKK